MATHMQHNSMPDAVAAHTRTHAEAATGANGAANASPYVSSDTRSCYKLQSSKVGGMVSL